MDNLPPIPAPYATADWRRRIADLYAAIRAEPNPETGWRLWHKTRSRLFRDHPASPLSETQKACFDAITVWPYDPALRFEVDLVAQQGPTIDFELGTDGTMRARPVARTDGLKQGLGAELTLWWIGGYGGGLFLPFRDATCGAGSYGGGRYAIDAIKSSDLGLAASGRLILDFNFAYTPSCAWSPDWVCPLAPPENRVEAAITAGERDPSGDAS
ncbi:DUF1684 domain-containing protein [Limimaricola hongkongensis]|uniref:DUF1684 domain-containing protein n=1 Tax=Limimaricola hongkongensis DSM 17492 TaxID=1122180 RepID=A0A017H9S9_9RHOB|nr:DUF1684 domain-containing protein [Limimaricola hongkongensis]EYD71272.1 hypothetical protein Lokhon_02920 [Limimaricola hongkongensis DSM 17492]